MRRTAEVILAGKLLHWTDQGRQHIVALLLYYAKQDLGLVPPLPRPCGTATDVCAVGLSNGTKHLLYWVFEGLLDDVLATFPEDRELAAVLEGALAESKLSVPAVAGDLQYYRLCVRVFRAIKSVIEATVQGKTPRWLAARPFDEEGRRLYVHYISSLLGPIEEEIQFFELLIADHQWSPVVVDLARAYLAGEQCDFALSDALAESGKADRAEWFRNGDKAAREHIAKGIVDDAETSGGQQNPTSAKR